MRSSGAARRRPPVATVPPAPPGRHGTLDFGEALLEWFSLHRRDLPWRRDRTPYAVLVSEVMLQQTTVAAVVPYFERFMAAFPTVQALARASEQEVLAAWAGLGYYRRARHLHATARAVAARRSEFPATRDELLALPGIGPYTAGAMLSLAFGVPCPAVDGNVARVMSRVLGASLAPDRTRDRRRLEEEVLRRMPAERAADFTEALMELGATTCTPRSPACGTCPVARGCAARRTGRQHELPSPRTRPAPVAVVAAAAWIERRGRVLLARRRDDETLMPGLWELPGGFAEGPPGAWLALNVLPALGGGVVGPEVARVRHAVTHRRITVHVHACTLERPPRERAGLRLVRRSEARALPLTAATARALDAVSAVTRGLVVVALALLAAAAPPAAAGPDAPEASALALQDEAGVRSARDVLAAAEARGEADATAAALDALVDALVAAGRGGGAEARSAAERSLALRSSAHPRHGESLGRLARVLYEAGELAASRARYEEALAALLRTRSADDADVGNVSNDLGLLLQEQGDLRGAREHLDRALESAERSPEPDLEVVAQSCLTLGVVVRDLGDLAAARALFARALELVEQRHGPRHPEVAHALDFLASAQGDDGAAARALLERALSIREATLPPEHPDLALSLNNLGTVLHREEDHAGARRLLERALRLHELSAAPDPQHVANTLTNLGLVHLELGDLAAARPLFERALESVRRVLGPRHPHVATRLQYLAYLHESAGDLSSAQQLYEQALAIFEESLGPHHANVGQGLAQLAQVMYQRGDLAAARPLLERAVHVLEDGLGDDRRTLASALRALAQVRAAEGDLVVARALAERALAVAETHAHDEIGVAVASHELASIHRDTGDLVAAIPLFERALAGFERRLGPQHPHAAKAQGALAQVLAAVGRTDRALDLALAAEDAGREHARSTLRALSAREALAHAAVRPVGLGTALSIVAAGDVRGLGRTWDSLVRSRALVLDELGGRRQLARSAEDPETARLARELLAASSRLAALTLREDERPADERRAAIERAREATEATERALSARLEGFGRERERARAGLADVLGRLERGDALVAFVRYGRTVVAAGPVPASGHRGPLPRPVPSYLALVARGDGRAMKVVDLGDAEALERRIAEWRRAASRPGPWSVEATSAGFALHEAAWAPVAAHVAGSRRVFVVPDGALHLVNLDALPVDEARFLIETGPEVRRLSAERDLASPAPERTSDVELLALGGPAFEARARGGRAGESEVRTATSGLRSTCGALAGLRFETLPHAAAEARAIAGAWSETAAPERRPTLLVDQEATEARFKDLAPGARVLHLATHGFFLGPDCGDEDGTGRRGLGLSRAVVDQATGTESPLLSSGLALAGANRRDEAGPDDEDGLLTAEEVAALDLSSCEWAVLSACGTGLGEVRGGEGVLGLERAFRVAGADAVVVSLWSVDDEATLDWMRHLYRARREGRDVGACARSASLAVLAERRERGLDDSPFWWGSFVGVGLGR